MFKVFFLLMDHSNFIFISNPKETKNWKIHYPHSTNFFFNLATSSPTYTTTQVFTETFLIYFLIKLLKFNVTQISNIKFNSCIKKLPTKNYSNLNSPPQDLYATPKSGKHLMISFFFLTKYLTKWIWSLSSFHYVEYSNWFFTHWKRHFRNLYEKNP